MPTPGAVNHRVIAEVTLLLEWLVVASLVAMLASRPEAFDSPPFVLLAVACRVAGTTALTVHAIGNKGISATACLLSTLLTAAVVVNLATAGFPEATGFWVVIALQIAGAAAVTAGLGLPWWVAVPLQFGLGLLNAISVSPAFSHETPASFGLGHYLAFAVLPGLAGCGVRLLLHREASEASTALRDALASQVAASQRAARLAHRDEHRRALHDTALNTLGAIGRGGLEDAKQSVRQHARRDAESLTRLADIAANEPPDLSLREQIHHVIADFTDAGMRIQLSLSALPEVPPQVCRALAAACREALNNAGKYAGRCEVSVSVVQDRTGIQLRVRDDGRGFSPDSTDFGLGLRQSIAGRMADIGGTAAVHSVPERGTEVVLVWHPAGEELPAPPPTPEPHRLGRRIRQIALLMIIVYTLSAALSVIAVWTSNGVTVLDAVAATVFVSVAAATFVEISRKGTLSAHRSALLMLHAPVCMLLTGLPLPGCQAMGVNMPFGGCMVGVAVVLALLRPAREAALFASLCAASWFVLAIQALAAGDWCAVIAVTNAVAVVAAATCTMWFVRAIRHHSQAAGSALTARGLAQAATRTEQLIADDRTQLYGVLAATVLPTLRGIGNGGLDPGDPTVRTRCASDTVLLRAYLNDVLTGHPVTSAIFALAVELQPTGPRLDIRGIGGAHDVPAGIVTTMVNALRSQLLRYPALAATQRSVSVTVVDDGTTVEISLVCDYPLGSAPVQPQQPLSSDLVETSVEGTDEDQLWVRLTHHRLSEIDVPRSAPGIAGKTAAVARRRLSRTSV